MPVMKCLVSSGLFAFGRRGRGAGSEACRAREQHIASFMLDTFCLGVKDVYFRTVGREEAEYMLETLDGADPIEAVEPGEMRKLLHDLVAWAGGNGFVAPHVDYVPGGSGCLATWCRPITTPHRVRV